MRSVRTDGTGEACRSHGKFGTLIIAKVVIHLHESGHAGAAAESHAFRVPVAAVVVHRPALWQCDLAGHPIA